MTTLQDLIDYHRKAAYKVKYDAQVGGGGGSGRFGARMSYQFHLDAAALLETALSEKTTQVSDKNFHHESYCRKCNEPMNPQTPDNEVSSYKYDRQKNCPHCNAFSLGENCNCCDSRTFECGTDVWENGTCRSAECYEREISSLSRVVENLQEILKNIRESV